MSMDWKKPIIALRSLTTEHHAQNIDPKIISVTWNLGKRCNYDCSYCNPAVHDWVSTHLPLTVIKEFMQTLDRYLRGVDKKYKISLTGGEPFVHPHIIEILHILSSQQTCERITAITNGSLPVDLYEQGFKYLKNFTVSLHLERPEKEIHDKLEKILYLHNTYPQIYLNVQVMCLPGKFDFIQNIVIPFLESNNIKFVCRRIRPWLNEAIDEWQENPHRYVLKNQPPLELQTEYKLKEKHYLQNVLGRIYSSEEYYSREELEWLEKYEPKTAWQNIGVWSNDLTYHEINSDRLVSNNLNLFTGWQCFVGIDCIYVDFDGNIYKGYCNADGVIGNIHRSDQIQFADQPTICNKKFCTSNPDQTTRKSQPEYMHLITQEYLGNDDIPDGYDK
jgi:organic radical activating enzyme